MLITRINYVIKLKVQIEQSLSLWEKVHYQSIEQLKTVPFGQLIILQYGVFKYFAYEMKLSTIL